MIFASPIWLALLFPWTILTLWLLRMRPAKRQEVPFVELWRGSAAGQAKASELFHPPPLALLAILLAVLLAILATAAPSLKLQAAGDERAVTVVVDCGITMSSPARRDEVVTQANDALRRLGAAKVNLVNVPGERATVSVSNWKESIARAVALDMDGAVQGAVVKALGESGIAVLVLTDRPIANSDSRVIQIAPGKALDNLGIVRFAIRDGRKRQAMVTIRNDSASGRAVLKIETGKMSITREIGLPTRGTEQNFFFDLDDVGASATASIDVRDDLEVDNAEHLARQHPPPRLEIRGTVPQDVQRVVEAYGRARPAGEGGMTIAITSSAEALSPDDAGVIVGSSVSGAEDVRTHPLGANIDWSRLADHPTVAVKETAPARIWITPPTAEFARTPEFVVMWTNILDHLREGASESFVSTRVIDRAPVFAPIRTDVRSRVAAITRNDPQGLNLLPFLAIAAAACALVAAVTWPAKRLTRFFAALTV